MSNKYNQNCLEKVAEIIRPYTEKLFGEKYDEKVWDEVNNKVLDYFEETSDKTELEFAEDWFCDFLAFLVLYTVEPLGGVSGKSGATGALFGPSFSYSAVMFTSFPLSSLSATYTCFLIPFR